MTMSLAVEWGPEEHSRQCDRARTIPTEGAWDKLNPLAETGVGATQVDDVPRAASARWTSCVIS